MNDSTWKNQSQNCNQLPGIFEWKFNISKHSKIQFSKKRSSNIGILTFYNPNS